MKNKMTFGLELELPDVDTNVELPAHIGSFDMKDFTIANSDGLANDPKKKYFLVGSEVNMTPTDSIDQMMDNVESLYSLVSTKTNHKSNLHVHIGVESLADDFEKLHKLHAYTYKHEKYVMSKVDALPASTTDKMAERIKHLLKSHQYTYAKSYQERILDATTCKDIGDAHQPIRKRDGKRLTHLHKRAGINLRSIFSRGAIEFRHFFGTDDFDQYRDALEWCKLYVENAIGDQKHPNKLLASREWNFPKMAPWNEELQTMWEYTNLEHNKRGEVKERINQLLNENKINRQHLGSMFG